MRTRYSLRSDDRPTRGVCEQLRPAGPLRGDAKRAGLARAGLASWVVLAFTHLTATHIAAPAASAQSQPKAAVPKIDCAAATATAELNHCAEIRLKKAEIDLATAMDKARTFIGRVQNAIPEVRTKWLGELADTQKAWSGYREADCKGLVPLEWQGGTGTTLAVLECMAQLTVARAYELNERYVERR